MLAAVLAAQQDSEPGPGSHPARAAARRRRLVAVAPAATQARRRRGARRGPRTRSPIPSIRERLKRAPRRLWTPAIRAGVPRAVLPRRLRRRLATMDLLQPDRPRRTSCSSTAAPRILIREITRLWGKSWPTILAFGAAYGICEEGLSTKVFFDLHRTNLGPEMQYGTWAGVHWPYMFHLIIAHAVFSIAVPIFLTMLLFPQRASEPWVRRRTLPVLGAVFVGGIVFSSLVLYRRNPDHPHHVIQVTPPHYLIAIARRADPDRRRTPAPRTDRATRTGASRCHRSDLAIVGFSGMFVFWGVSYLFPAWHVPVAITMILEVLIIAIVVAWFVVAPRGRPVLLVRARRRHAQLLRVHIVHPHGDRFVPPAGRERDGRLRIGATRAFTAGANRAR